MPDFWAHSSAAGRSSVRSVKETRAMGEITKEFPTRISTVIELLALLSSLDLF